MKTRRIWNQESTLGKFRKAIFDQTFVRAIVSRNVLREILPAKSDPPAQRNKITYFKIVKITRKEKGMLGSTIFQTWFVPYRPPPLSIYIYGYICIACIILIDVCMEFRVTIIHARIEGQLQQFPIKGLLRTPPKSHLYTYRLMT